MCACPTQRPTKRPGHGCFGKRTIRQRLFVSHASGSRELEPSTSDVRSRIETARKYKSVKTSSPDVPEQSSTASVITADQQPDSAPQQAVAQAELDIKARLARAKQYKQSVASGQAAVTSGQLSPDGASTAISTPSPGIPGSVPGPGQTPASEPSLATGKGATRGTAAWLSGVMSEAAEEKSKQYDKNMRPEEFQQVLEARKRSQQVEIISIDKDYKPKVNTWGVFPRPANISEAYGGGRNITPGQVLETPEEAAANVAKTRAALEQYRRTVGAYVDEELEAECQKQYKQGEEAMKRGALQQAYDTFDSITQKMDVKTVLGGLATLQKAIVLDSYGYHDKAQSLYRSLTAHPAATISAKAKRMLFGFEAAKFLKADQIDYSGKKKEWTKYFIQNSRDIYIATPEEKARDEAAARAASVLALGIVIGPVVAIGALALTRHGTL